MSCTIVSNDTAGEMEVCDPLVEILGDFLVEEWMKKNLPRVRQTRTSPVGKVGDETKKRGKRSV